MVTDQDSLEQARSLAREISRLARAHENKALLEIDAANETEPLLALLPEPLSKQAEVHLRGARIWQAKQNRRAQEKLDAASKALDELDLVLARGILRKIDSALLDEAGLSRYDELLIAVTARAVELEEIQNQMPSPPSGGGSAGRRRFWKR